MEISCCFISYVPFSHLYLKMSLCVKEDDSEKFCLLCETKTSLVSCFPQAPSGCTSVCAAHGELCHEIPQYLETSRAKIIKN